jgi:hypothetical protein
MNYIAYLIEQLIQKVSHMGAIMVKRARGTKIKVLFQILLMTRVIFMLVYNLELCIWNTPLHFTYKCILTTN